MRSRTSSGVTPLSTFKTKRRASVAAREELGHGVEEAVGLVAHGPVADAAEAGGLGERGLLAHRRRVLEPHVALGRRAVRREPRLLVAVRADRHVIGLARVGP